MPPPDDLPRPLGGTARALALSRRGVMRVLIAVSTLMVLAGVAVTVTRLSLGHNRLFGLARFLDINVEGNLPTWFQGALFLLAAIATAAIARLERASRPAEALRWGALALAILFMSLDEQAAIHERFTIPERWLGPYGSIHNFTWVFLGVLFMAAVAALFLRFVLSLPARTRNGILLAGGLFVIGAAGFEAIGGIWALGHGEQNYVYAAIFTLEETLEIAGALVLMDALLAHLAAMGGWRGEVS